MKTLEIMKQPALGIKISELRKNKGLTQEELVAECNISVRTIQRIEAGEVTPRSYTIKTILAALDCNLDEIQSESNPINKEFKKLFLLQIDDSKKIDFLIKNLNIAWISGIIYFLIGFAEIPIDYLRYFENELVISKAVYIIIKILTLASIFLFYRGFILTGEITKNYLLRITSFIFIFVAFIFYSYDILSLYFGEFDFEFVAGASAITFGIVGVLLGIAVLRLKPILGNLATATGIFEIISYALMITVLLVVVGLGLTFPMIILEIILIYKIVQMLISKKNELNQ